MKPCVIVFWNDARLAMTLEDVMESVNLFNTIRFLSLTLALPWAAYVARGDEASVARLVKSHAGEVKRDDSLPGRPIVGLHLYSLDLTDADVEELTTLKH